MGVIEYSGFAREIDSRIQCACLSCYPEVTDDTCSCKWAFSIPGIEETAMRKTYVTRMPDKAGAFLLASRIIAACGGNIARVNYNRAVDTHTLFIEVSATAAQHAEIARQLSACGYLTELEDGKRILMIVLTLPDHPGAVTPVLEVLSRHRVNISYISSQENGTGVQHFKMGLLIENTGEIKRLIDEISRICEISILNYEVTDRLLDGTVFYITFANEMREILSLSQAQTNAVLIQANQPHAAARRAGQAGASDV